MIQELDLNQCIHWRLQKFYQGGNVAIWLFFITPNIKFFEHFLQFSHNVRINQWPEQHER